MKTFTDNASRSWTIQLTLDAVKRVRNLVGINLLELEGGDPPLLTRLGTDVLLLCDVIYALIKPQADQRQGGGVSDEQFAAALGGDAILAAQTAFYEELVDFFRGLHRGDLVKVVQMQRRMIDLAVARIETRIDGFDLEAAVRSTLCAVSEGSESNRGGSSMSLPASSASTPGP
ncbi:MAG: hypothetical protein IT442_11360 [Phycisphaeraceae bacterium]|nr:hypothetical protein [Phycisphaeraceae bacterium]